MSTFRLTLSLGPTRGEARNWRYIICESNSTERKRRDEGVGADLADDNDSTQTHDVRPKPEGCALLSRLLDIHIGLLNMCPPRVLRIFSHPKENRCVRVRVCVS